MRILVIEDNASVAGAVRSMLERRKYAVDVAHDGETGLDHLLRQTYDAAIVDVVLPGRDGFSIASAAREQGVQTPLLMLTARDAIEDRVRGLDCGADDYLVKPFVEEELFARIRAVTRRADRPVQELLTVGNLRIDSVARQATYDGLPLELGSTEFRMLELFVRNAGIALTRDQMLERLWEYEFDGSSNIVDVYVKPAAPQTQARRCGRRDSNRVGSGLQIRSMTARLALRYLLVFALVLAALSVGAYLFMAGEYRGLLAPALGTPETSAAYARAMRTVALTIAAFDVPLLMLVGAASWLLAKSSIEPLMRAQERERNFAADAAHALRSPLATIATVAQAARTGVAAQTDAALDTIARAALDASATVGDLLTLARGAHHELLAHEPVDLGAIVADASKEFAPRAAQRNVALVTDLHSGIVDADERRLRELTRNLMENALRHARSTVRVASCKADGAIELHVANDGDTVAPEEREKIFERFYQAKGHNGGAGLGLPIVRWIAEAPRLRPRARRRRDDRIHRAPSAARLVGKDAPARSGPPIAGNYGRYAITLPAALDRAGRVGEFVPSGHYSFAARRRFGPFGRSARHGRHFAALYGTLRHDPKRPEWEDRDRLLLSCGHIAPVRYRRWPTSDISRRGTADAAQIRNAAARPPERVSPSGGRNDLGTAGRRPGAGRRNGAGSQDGRQRFSRVGRDVGRGAPVRTALGSGDDRREVQLDNLMCDRRSQLHPDRRKHGRHHAARTARAINIARSTGKSSSATATTWPTFIETIESAKASSGKPQRHHRQHDARQGRFVHGRRLHVARKAARTPRRPKKRCANWEQIAKGS